MRALIWFTRDLRLQDNQIFSWLKAHPCEVMTVAFEPENAAPFGLRFFHQSVLDLQQKLAQQNITFTLLRGQPERKIAELVKLNRLERILVTKPYNRRDESVLENVLRANEEVESEIFDQNTLIRLEDLPFELPQMPDVFTSFRKKVEANLSIAQPVVTSLNDLKGFGPTFSDSIEIVELENVLRDPIALPFEFEGGETAAWRRIDEYFWQTGSLSHYKETRNGMLKKNDSSKLSPWLANGSLSARSLYQELKRYEGERGANESTYWLFFELLWRDYFKFLSLKIGEKLFSISGISEHELQWHQDQELFQAWRQGKLGMEFVDANMNELLLTGWMSNRGRQNVASQLAKGLGVDWTWGARYFESQLIDADPESNWGNWLYVAGVGTDPRDRKFKIDRQAEIYDASGAYRKKWL